MECPLVRATVRTATGSSPERSTGSCSRPSPCSSPWVTCSTSTTGAWTRTKTRTRTGTRRRLGRRTGRGRGGEEGHEPFGDDALLTVHVTLGVTVLLLGAARLAWRLATPLPPWAPTLTARERRFAHGTETTLYAATFAVPVTGIALLVPVTTCSPSTSPPRPSSTPPSPRTSPWCSSTSCPTATGCCAACCDGRDHLLKRRQFSSSSSRLTPVLSSFPEAFLGTAGTMVRCWGSL
ncbi:cytochrome b [Streptomyces sp. NPDC057438]|uniref:cytochrome b n=1 Tax=Streptomyces sp. NPDC057438 TaxID=3346133 RepID=UPI0036C908F1